MSPIIKPLVYRGSREICAAVGINYKEIRHYVDHLGLPAFKIEGRTQWLATYADLEAWIAKQRDKYVGVSE